MIKQLQERVGSKPKFSVENFQNWAGNQTSSVISCYPATKEEMSNVIKAATAENLVIRCAGARHSWAPVFADNRQICVNTKNLKSDYPDGSNIRADFTKRTVDVMAGVTTGDFKRFQVEQKLSILANVILDLVHVVSVAQTGCHGVGKDVQCVSDYLVKMRVFDANGELRTYSADGDGGDVELFRAVSAGFGCFGVVYDVTIQMDPEVIVKTGTSYPNMKDVFYSKEKLQEILENNWAVEIFWFPFNSHPLDLSNDELWLRTFNKHRLQGTETVVSHWFYKIKEAYDFISQEALRIVSPFLRASDSCAPHIQWVSFQTLKHILYPSGDIYQELPNAIHFRKYLDHAKVYDLEFVFDYKGDYSRLMKIIEVVVRQVKQFAAKNQYPLNVSLEMRFMTHSDAYLGTGSIANPRYGGTGHVVCIEVLSLKGTKHWEEFSTAVGKEWMELGGVPHLAKQFEHLPDIYADIRQKMAPQIEAFKDSLGKSGVDSSLYMNTGMRKLLI
ncbi:L-gulonolactone oxidase-like [Magallana gigas]|uniref:L-gulonolactone oxidase-like n=1 Tax=Magallana gigas TaxID=29159 RepID=UPI0033420D30